MKVDALVSKQFAELVPDAESLAADGYDGLWIAEAQHDPFLQVLEVARTAPGVQIGTAVAIAFARSPMTLANAGYDLARYTEGRFILGLGPQIKPHIERRFSMPWSRPARRMRELVLALRAIWSCWHEGAALDFRGEFYTHTLMTPNFAPPAHPFGPPPVYLAGVGELMTEVAGEVADGFLIHQLTSERYLREVTLDALDRGRARAQAGAGDGGAAQGRAGAGGAAQRQAVAGAGNGRGRPVVGGLAFVATGRDDRELDAAIAAVRYRIAFYASTPAYRAVLDLHGWGRLQPELNAMTKQGRWDEIAALVPDEVLHTFAVVGTPEEAGRGLATKYAGIADRLTLSMPYEHAAETKRAVCTALREASTEASAARSDADRPDADRVTDS